MHRLKLRLAGVASSESNIEILVYPSWLAIMEFVIFIVALILLLFWRRYHKDTKVLLEERNEIEGLDGGGARTAGNRTGRIANS